MVGRQFQVGQQVQADLGYRREGVDDLVGAHDARAVQRIPRSPQHLAEAGFDPHNPTLERLRILVNSLRGFPRHLSQHVGGFVIAAGRLDELVPIENAAMPGRTVIQWEKDDLEALGLLKVDVLALGMLSAIRRALDLLNGYWFEGNAENAKIVQRTRSFFNELSLRPLRYSASSAFLQEAQT